MFLTRVIALKRELYVSTLNVYDIGKFEIYLQLVRHTCN